MANIKPFPYMGFNFPRPKIDGDTKIKEIYFGGRLPLLDTFWRIERRRHIKNGDERMRLSFYDMQVDGNQPVPEEWGKADGLRITATRHKGQNPQYEYSIEPLYLSFE